MDIQKLKKNLKPYLTPFNLLILFVIIGVVVVVPLVLFQKNYEKQAQIKKLENSQIEIKDKDSIITINENGTIVFRSKNQVTYRNWDSARIKEIFQLIEQEAQKSSASVAAQAKVSYQASLTSQGRQQTINVIQGSKLSEILATLSQSLPSPLTSTNNTRPSPLVVSAKDQPNLPTGSNFPDPNCTLWGQQISGKTVISQTVCLKK